MLANCDTTWLSHAHSMNFEVKDFFVFIWVHDLHRGLFLFPHHTNYVGKTLMRRYSISAAILGIVLAHVTVESTKLSSSIRKLLKECLTKLILMEKGP